MGRRYINYDEPLGEVAHRVIYENNERQTRMQACNDVNIAMSTCDHRFDSGSREAPPPPPIQYWAGGSSDD